MALFELRLISNKMIHFLTTTKLPISLNISKNIQTEISQKFKENLGVSSNEEQQEIIILKEREVPKLVDVKDKLSVKIKLENGVVKTLDLVQVPELNTKLSTEKMTSSTETMKSSTETMKLRRETRFVGNDEIVTYSKEEVKFEPPEIAENSNPSKSKTILSNQSHCYGIPNSFGTWLRTFNTSKQVVNKNYASSQDYSSSTSQDSAVSEVPTMIEIMKEFKSIEYNSNINSNKSYVKLESTDGFQNCRCQLP